MDNKVPAIKETVFAHLHVRGGKLLIVPARILLGQTFDHAFEVLRALSSQILSSSGEDASVSASTDAHGHAHAHAHSKDDHEVQMQVNALRLGCSYNGTISQQIHREL